MKVYPPMQRDIIWLQFDPSTGEEIKGQHMALVISNNIVQENTGRAIVCPITSKVKKDRTLDIILPERITGKECAIVPDQIKSLDFLKIGSEFITVCPEKYFLSVIERINLCLSITK